MERSALGVRNANGETKSASMVKFEAAAPAAKRRAPAWSSSTEPGSNANAGSATQRHAWPASRNGLAATPAHGRPRGTIASYLPATYATPAA